MKEINRFGELTLYKQGNTYIAKLNPSFYIKERVFDGIQSDCNVLSRTSYGPYDEYTHENCKITEGACHVDCCPKIKTGDKKPENEIREALEDLIEIEIKSYKRDKLKIKNELRLEKFDGRDTGDLEKKLSRIEAMITELNKINPKTIELVYKPTPRLVCYK